MKSALLFRHGRILSVLTEFGLNCAIRVFGRAIARTCGGCHDLGDFAEGYLQVCSAIARPHGYLCTSVGMGDSNGESED
jgi:hypothetical protein